MVGYLSKEPKLSFVSDPGKFYRKRRRATQAKGLETLDPKAKVEGTSVSPRESPPASPKEDQHQPPHMGDPPIINLQDAGRPFKIKVSTMCMVQHSPFTGKEDMNLHL
jgi:hypothetical protein